MPEKNQALPRLKLILIVALCILPSLAEAAAVIWGGRQGYTGKALRDGLDFWAGGFLYLHHQLPVLFDHTAYQSFLQGMYGHLPYHLWSYPPSYGLIAAAFGWLSPWAAVLSFDALSLAGFAAVLRLAGKSWWFVAAMLLAPATLENALEHQNAALMTALIGGGLLLAQSRSRLGGALIGLASFKPQLGLVLPLYLLRRAPLAFLYAALAAVALAGVSLWAFGPASWVGFFHYTSPIMSNVLLTGQPKDFAGGLISVFATIKPLAGLHAAFAAQGVVTLVCILAALFTRSVPLMLILSTLASPYLHVYDLLGTSLAVALLVEQRLAGDGFRAGEPVLFFLVWFGPGLLPWHPAYAHLAPMVLVLLLASAKWRGAVGACDSSPAQPGSPVSPAGPLPIPVPPGSTTSG
jgi:Glycosyltransferase family 87